MKNKKILFVVNAIRWYDKPNGNTYHSVRITRTKDKKVFVSDSCVYGYDNHYRQTALRIMLDSKLLPRKYNKDNCYLYERENNYPILWECQDGLKRDMINNVK
jgi:hypothetical protein